MNSGTYNPPVIELVEMPGLYGDLINISCTGPCTSDSPVIELVEMPGLYGDLINIFYTCSCTSDSPVIELVKESKRANQTPIPVFLNKLRLTKRIT